MDMTHDRKANSRECGVLSQCTFFNEIDGEPNLNRNDFNVTWKQNIYHKSRVESKEQAGQVKLCSDMPGS